MREGEDANRTREAGHLDEIQGDMANTLKSYRHGAVGFIDWLDPFASKQPHKRSYHSQTDADNATKSTILHETQIVDCSRLGLNGRAIKEKEVPCAQ